MQVRSKLMKALTGELEEAGEDEEEEKFVTPEEEEEAISSGMHTPVVLHLCCAIRAVQYLCVIMCG